MNTEQGATRGSFANKKDKLVTDLKGVVADADDLLKEVGRSSAEEFAVARANIEGRLGGARAGLEDARNAVTEKVRGAADATEGYVKENPWTAIGVGLAAGLIVGFLVSRR